MADDEKTKLDLATAYIEPGRADPPVNSGLPSVHVDEYHSGGLILDDQKEGAGAILRYEIVDGASGRSLCEEGFSSYRAAQEYVARHLADREKWLPPPPSEEEHAQLLRILEFLEKQGPGRWKNPPSNRSFWVHLSYYLHQRTHLPEVTARMRVVLEGNPYD